MYGVRQRHERVKEAVDSYLASSDAAVVRLDTLIRDNDTGINSAAQLEALIRSCDAVVTSRLHGMVYSLRNGVPVVVIDAVAGGAKVTAQARTLGWPLLLDGDAITPSIIAAAVLQAMEPGSRELAYSVAESARERIDALRAAVLDDITLHMTLA